MAPKRPKPKFSFPSPKRSPQEWSVLIKDYQASGLSVLEWCQKNRINPVTLRDKLTLLNKSGGLKEGRTFGFPEVVELLQEFHTDKERATQAGLRLNEDDWCIQKGIRRRQFSRLRLVEERNALRKKLF